MEAFAVVNRKSLAVKISERPRGGIAVFLGDEGTHPAHAGAGMVKTLEHIEAAVFRVLYEAVDRRDRQLGRNVRYSLAPPEPWLLVVSTVMWQGILQGMSWDTVKVAVRLALDRLRSVDAAPTTTVKTKKKSGTRFGFRWTEYAEGRKSRELFVGLERVYREETVKKKGLKSGVRKRS